MTRPRINALRSVKGRHYRALYVPTSTWSTHSWSPETARTMRTREGWGEGGGRVLWRATKGDDGLCACVYTRALITAVLAVFGQLETARRIRDAGEARILGPRALVIIANYGRGGRLKAIFACTARPYMRYPAGVSRCGKNARRIYRIAR